MNTTKRLKNLSVWDWEVLIGAIRYYEDRTSIVAAVFPMNLIKRFFTGKYKDEVCHKIAHQFVGIDHCIEGEKFWAEHPNDIRRYWCKLYAFLKAYLNGFTIKEGVECFYCETTNLYYIKDNYIENPHAETYIVE